MMNCTSTVEYLPLCHKLYLRVGLWNGKQVKQTDDYIAHIRIRKNPKMMYNVELNCNETTTMCFLLPVKLDFPIKNLGTASL